MLSAVCVFGILPHEAATRPASRRKLDEAPAEADRLRHRFAFDGTRACRAAVVKPGSQRSAARAPVKLLTAFHAACRQTLSAPKAHDGARRAPLTFQPASAGRRLTQRRDSVLPVDVVVVREYLRSASKPAFFERLPMRQIRRVAPLVDLHGGDLRCARRGDGA